MRACYLALEEEWIRKSVYPLSGTVTIGRGTHNAITLSHPTVSRTHAKIKCNEGIWFIEDMGSANGIFVDDNRVENAALEPGKTYRIGKAALRFIERDASNRSEHFLETAEILSTSFDSKRLLRGIEMVPFFAPITKAELLRLANNATLHMFQDGQAIFSEGDPGRSIYVVLEGKVRIFIRDHYGRALELAILEVGDFLGEMSFLTGRPRSATATTVVSSLLVEIGHESLKSLFQEQPRTKKILLEYYRKRLAGNKKTLAELKFEEQRKDSRLRDPLPVSLALIAESNGLGNRPNSWETSSLDISISGIRVVLSDVDPQTFHSGDKVKLEISLPDPWNTINCFGHIRKAWTSRDNPKVLVLGIRFIELSVIDLKKLREYIYGDTHIDE
jgi:CRP-like cAMP-binding protein